MIYFFGIFFSHPETIGVVPQRLPGAIIGGHILSQLMKFHLIEQYIGCVSEPSKCARVNRNNDGPRVVVVIRGLITSVPDA
jgi:hypothetical protein